MKDSDKKLYRLDELTDFKVDSDDPDIRGWKVKDQDGQMVGEVDNLLVNKKRRKVVYLDVEVDNSIIKAGREKPRETTQTDSQAFENKEGENHIIIPIGLVSIDQDDNYVYTSDLSHQRFAEANRFKKGDPISSDYERYIIAHYRGEDPSTHRDMNEDDFYESREFDRSKSRNKNRK